MALRLDGLCPLIQVYDMPESLQFYRDKLGFAVVNTSEEIEAPEGRHFYWARLRHGDAELMLNTAYDAGERPQRRDATREKAHQDTILFVACADVDGAFASLKAAGLTIDPPAIAPYGMKQLFLTDPDGYQVCLQAPA